jgi:hypothetical protein
MLSGVYRPHYQIARETGSAHKLHNDVDSRIVKNLRKVVRQNAVRNLDSAIRRYVFIDNLGKLHAEAEFLVQFTRRIEHYGRKPASHGSESDKTYVNGIFRHLYLPK